tara:strand:+ start:259 stop:672 length:414 start_codon:yes stop_codon:yes gene_type:complete
MSEKPEQTGVCIYCGGPVYPEDNRCAQCNATSPEQPEQGISDAEIREHWTKLFETNTSSRGWPIEPKGALRLKLARWVEDRCNLRRAEQIDAVTEETRQQMRNEIVGMFRNLDREDCIIEDYLTIPEWAIKQIQEMP